MTEKEGILRMMPSAGAHRMTSELKKVVAIAAVIVSVIIAAFLVGGRFMVVPVTTGVGVFVVDRLTGSVRICTRSLCTYVPMDPYPLEESKKP
jgi:hypothetical protein